MKVEIGESLIYSFLRHEKKCLITQTNWKASGNWDIPKDVQDNAIYEFDKINKHHAFSEIFKSDFSQTIKQAEIDVLGIGQNNHIYAFEIAFHENGLQYGGKIETRNRIFKKLLRGYITLKCYFPGYKYSLAFCSPKVNPATEKHIQEYFEVLMHDFRSEDINFHYYSNDKFNAEIAQRTLSKTINEADSNELFARSIKLLNITNKYNSVANRQSTIQEPVSPSAEPSNRSISSGEHVKIQGFSIPVEKESSESVQDYVKKIMRLLLNNNLLSINEIENIQDKQYCKRAFALPLPLIRNTSEGYKDKTGKPRYYHPEIFGGKYYLCSQWWKDNHPTHLIKLKEWLMLIKNL